MDHVILEQFEDSLRRCNADPDFLDRFYERFLRSSPKVREKFRGTDFIRQKRMLQASLQLLLVAAQDDGERPTPGPAATSTSSWTPATPSSTT